MKTVATYNHPFDADLARGFLETRGISAFVKDENMGSYLIYNTAIGGVRLQVLEEDFEKATEILREYTNEVAPEATRLKNIECPRCHSTKVNFKHITLMHWLFAFIFIGVPFLFYRPFYKCETCRNKWREKPSYEKEDER